MARTSTLVRTGNKDNQTLTTWTEESARRYEAYRSQIEHEDSLIGVRIGWLIGGEAFLFAAYAAVLAIQTQDPNRGYFVAAHQLFLALPWMGIILASLVSVSVLAAQSSMDRLCEEFKIAGASPLGYPDLMSIPQHRLWGHYTARYVPWLIAVTWAFVFFTR